MDVQVVPTESSLNFVGAATWEALTHRSVSTAVFDRVEDVNHVRLGQEADLIAVVPATADFLARSVAGRASDLLGSTLLAARCDVAVFPAMHTEMWEHPATAANVKVLRERGTFVFDPAVGRLTGADSGPGRLPDPESIALTISALVARPASGTKDLTGSRWVISAGGTREALDPVRYLTNRSSGKQGHALAAAAVARGAEVSLVTTANAPIPCGVNVVRVSSALELHEQMIAAAATHDVVVMAAAVSDYRPATQHDVKLKKSGTGGLTLDLVQNPDILRDLVEKRSGVSPVLVGFAAETGDDNDDELGHARKKYISKGCDYLVCNSVAGGAVFGDDTTTVHVLQPQGNITTCGPVSKLDAAHHIIDSVELPAR